MMMMMMMMMMIWYYELSDNTVENTSEMTAGSASPSDNTGATDPLGIWLEHERYAKVSLVMCYIRSG
jgi:hypothetical protein